MITTIGQLRRILEYFEDDDHLVMFEYRYNGGGNELHEPDICVAFYGNGLAIIPGYDADGLAMDKIIDDVIDPTSFIQGEEASK